jgi:hypothetical protein
MVKCSIGKYSNFVGQNLLYNLKASMKDFQAKEEASRSPPKRTSSISKKKQVLTVPSIF